MKSSTIIRRMSKSRLFMMGFFLLIIMFILCFSAPLWVQWDPGATNLAARNAAPDWFSDGLAGHPFGCDPLGRDVLTRLAMGGRISLSISAVVTVSAMLIGSLVGLSSAYFGGAVDRVLMRFTDILMAVPQLMLAICVVGVLGGSIFNLILTLIVTSWMMATRLIRSRVLGFKNQEFVSASRVLGANNRRIMWKELFPNVLTQIMISASATFGGTILQETALSYLGMGVPAPTPSWGNMISDGRNYLTSAPWVVLAPGVALMLTVMAFNFIGDGLRDVFDPKNTN